MALTSSLEEIIAKNFNGLLGKHESWVRMRLGDIAEVQNGAPYDSASFNNEGVGMPLLRIRDVLSETTEAFYSGEYQPHEVVHEGDLIIGMDGDFNCARWRGADALLNQRVCRIMPRSTLVNWDFVFFALPGYLEAINEATPSVTVKHLSSHAVEQIPLPLPPRAEQNRIVNKLNELCGQTAAGQREIDAVVGVLRDFRAKVVSAAFDPTWPRLAFKEVAEVKANLVSPAAYPTLPHIAPNHIESKTGRLLPYRSVSEDGVTSAKHLFSPGQILYSKIRPYLAKATLVDFEGLCSADMYPIETVLETPFLLYWLLSSDFTALAAGEQGRSVLPKINKTELGLLPVPVPSAAEQKEAVKRIDVALAGVDELIPAVPEVARLGKALSRSVLRTAFEGNLVGQVASDGDASNLAAAIKAETDARPSRKKSRARAEVA